MIYPLIFILTFSFSLIAKDRCPTFFDPERNLTWHDEFDSPELDKTKWTPSNDLYSSNNELQAYTDRPENLFIQDGVLHFMARKEEIPFERSYSSGKIESYPQKSFLYGRFEFCVRYPKGQGLWPAAWMMPENPIYGPWPSSGEIDIVENIGHIPQTNWGTIHYGPAWPNNQMTGNTYTLPEGDFSQNFHSFALEWEPEVLRWYVDDILYSVKTPADLGEYQWVYDHPFHLILNLAIGGDWAGPPDNETVFPQSFQVDYVRVYSR